MKSSLLTGPLGRTTLMIVASLSSFRGFTQISEVSTYHILPNLSDYMLTREANKSLYGSRSDIDGSPYLNESFELGEVYAKGHRFEGIQMRYDIFDDWVEFMQKGNTYVLDPNEAISKILIGNDVLVVENIPERKDKKPVFLLRLDSGKVSLMARKIIFYRPPKPAGALESSNTPAKYAPQPDRYFLKVSEGVIREVSSVKEIMSHLPGEHQELSEFINREDLSNRKEEDMIKLVQYYNSLP